MKFENAFVVQAPIDEVYAALLDVERVAPCMPGAEVVEKTGDDAYKVAIKVKVGPMSMTYKGDVQIVERDDAAKTATLRAKAKESRGQGTADAHVHMALAEEGDGTHATLETDVALGGRVAAMGRGVIADVSARLVQTFAGNLAEMLEGGGTAEPSSTTAPPSPSPRWRRRGECLRARGDRRASEPDPHAEPRTPAPEEAGLPVGELVASVVAGRLSESEGALRRGRDLCDDLPRDRLPRRTGQMILAHIAGDPGRGEPAEPRPGGARRDHRGGALRTREAASRARRSLSRLHAISLRPWPLEREGVNGDRSPARVASGTSPRSRSACSRSVATARRG